MEPNTLTRREYKGKIHVENIRKNSCRIRNQLKSRIWIRIRKKSFRIHITAVRRAPIVSIWLGVYVSGRKIDENGRGVIHMLGGCVRVEILHTLCTRQSSCDPHKPPTPLLGRPNTTWPKTASIYCRWYSYLNVFIENRNIQNRINNLQGGSNKSGIFFFLLSNDTAQLRIIRFDWSKSKFA